MLKLIGTDEILRNLIRLSKPYLIGIPNKHSLQVAFRQFLRIAQPRVPKPEHGNPCLLSKKEDISVLLEVFKEES